MLKSITPFYNVNVEMKICMYGSIVDVDSFVLGHNHQRLPIQSHIGDRRPHINTMHLCIGTVIPDSESAIARSTDQEK